MLQSYYRRVEKNLSRRENFPPHYKNSSFAQGCFANLEIVMTMHFSFGETYENTGDGDAAFFYPSATHKSEKIHFFAEKLSAPAVEDFSLRPRINQLLEKSFNQTGAVLINGRTGTGKTALAADFSKNYDQTIWYRIDAADADWKIFANYLSKAVTGKSLKKHAANVAALTEKIFTDNSRCNTEATRLIVFDDVHNVFDAAWFNEFFTTALYSAAASTHLLFLARSKPAVPLWRLRSKQVLSVIDEKVLAFDCAEIEDFCRERAVPTQKVNKLFAESFGRIGKLKSLAEII